MSDSFWPHGARQAPLSMGFCRQEYWSGLPCPPPGDLSNPEIKPASLVSPALAGGCFTTSATWEAPWGTDGRVKITTAHVILIIPFLLDLMENIHCWPRLSPNDYCKFHQKTLKKEQKDAVTTAVGSHPLDEHWQGQGTTGLNGTGDSPWPMAFILVVCTYFYKGTTLIYACLISFNFHIDEKLPMTEWKKH